LTGLAAGPDDSPIAPAQAARTGAAIVPPRNTAGAMLENPLAALSGADADSF